MATTKPRITITLEPHVHRTVHILAKLQHRSMSAMVAELLLDMEPILHRAGVILQDARTVPEQVRAAMVEGMSRAQGRIEAEWSAVPGQKQLLEPSRPEKRGASTAARSPRASARRPSKYG